MVAAVVGLDTMAGVKNVGSHSQNAQSHETVASGKYPRERRMAVQFLTGVLMVGLLGGCAIDLAVGAGVGGAAEIESGRVGEAVRERASENVGAMDGEGRGRVPGPAHGCPADLEALQKLMREVPRGSDLTAEELAAGSVLYRAAVICDPEVGPVYLEWSGR